MIDRSHALPPTRQAEALSISRGTIYYVPRPVSPGDLALMRQIDALHLDFPFARGCCDGCCPANIRAWGANTSVR